MVEWKPISQVALRSRVAQGEVRILSVGRIEVTHCADSENVAYACRNSVPAIVVEVEPINRSAS